MGKPRARPVEGPNPDTLIALALVGCVYVLGGWIPVPGVVPLPEPDIMDAAVAPPPLSVLMLGLQPVLSVLLLFEGLKLLVPALARWDARPHTGRLRPRTLVVALALLLAAVEGNDLHQALALEAIVRDDALSTHAMVATLVAGVATLLVLSERIAVPGLALGGFWLVVSIPWAEALVSWFVELSGLVRAGRVDAAALVLAFGLVGAAVAAIVVLATALRESVGAAGGDPLRWSPLLVWPPLLAGGLADVVAFWAGETVWSPLDVLPFSNSTAWTLGYCATLPAVMWLQVRSIARLSPHGQDWPGRRAIPTLLVLVQIAICLGLFLVPDDLLAPSWQASTLVVVVAAFSAAGRASRRTVLCVKPHSRQARKAL